MKLTRAQQHELFGALRAQLHEGGAEDAEGLQFLLEHILTVAPVFYAQVCRPYLAGFSLPLLSAWSLDSLAHLAALLPADAPRRYVHLGDPLLTAELRAVASSPHMAWVTTLDLTAAHLGPDGLDTLLSTSSLRHLTTLHLAYNDTGPDGAALLASALSDDRLPALTTLYLNNNDLGDAGVRALLALTRPRVLDVLHLGFNDLTDASATLLATTTTLRVRSLLDVRFNRFTGAGIQTLRDATAHPHTLHIHTG